MEERGNGGGNRHLPSPSTISLPQKLGSNIFPLSEGNRLRCQCTYLSHPDQNSVRILLSCRVLISVYNPELGTGGGAIYIILRKTGMVWSLPCSYFYRCPLAIVHHPLYNSCFALSPHKTVDTSRLDTGNKYKVQVPLKLVKVT